MRAIVLTGTGGSENLLLTDIEEPTPRNNEVLIKVKAFGINPIDIKTRKGFGAYGRLKNETLIILGWDVSGVVVSIGPEVSDYKIGDEVFGMINFPGHGKTYSEFVSAPQSHLALKPKSLTHEEAAASSLALLTAWQAFVHEAKVSKGQRVLVHAAAGGVGHFAVQIAKYLGAYVIGTASSKNRDFIKELGADDQVDYNEVKFEDVIKDIDFVFDCVGGDVTVRSFKVLRDSGLLITIPSGMGDEWRKIAVEQNINACSFTVSSSGANMQRLAELLEEGRLRPHVSEIFTMEQIREAHKRIETGRTRGKLVVKT